MDPSIRLALSFHQAGRLAEAEGIYRQILSRCPDHASVLNLLGALAVQTGRHPWAVGLLDRAIVLRPDIANYHNNLGEALRHTGNLPGAISAYRQAARLNPGLAVTHNNLGIALSEAGQPEAAVAEYRRAIALEPGYAEAYSNLGNALKDLGRLDDAAAACRTAARIGPGSAETFNTLGVVLAAAGETDEAVDAYRTALRLNPRHGGAWSNLGNALAARGDHDAAAAACAQAVAIDPEHIQSHWNLAVILLRNGDFQRGWREYEWRWRVGGGRAAARFEQPAWDGRPLGGQTILLHAEQGYGDTLQFVRYAPLVAQRGGRVILECHPQLCRLVRAVPGIERVIPRGEPLPAFAAHCPLMSLPLAFGTTLHTIPCDVPYVRAELGPGLRGSSDSARFKVGLCWAGNPGHSNDRNRSMRLSDLAPLVGCGAEFHSLQNGPASAPDDPVLAPLGVIDHAEHLIDFAATAALIEGLDLVVTVDTAVAHLAGAMGKPVWVLLPALADWRWLVDRADSPWYPSMRLFRQASTGQWASVIQQVRRELQEAVERRSIIAPQVGSPPLSRA